MTEAKALVQHRHRPFGAQVAIPQDLALGSLAEVSQQG
jgi:hypothetical protein